MKGNKESIDSLLSCLRNTDTRLLEVEFQGSVSPEGNPMFNRQLSRSRISAIEKHVLDRVPIPGDKITRKDNYINWTLLDALLAESDMGYKSVVQNAINAGDSDERIISAIKSIDGGAVWHDLLKRFFPVMRNSEVIVVTTSERPDEGDAIKPVSGFGHPVSLCSASSQSLERPPFTHTHTHTRLCLGVKTNSLLDLALIPNAGVEFPVGKDFSVTAGWAYSWWKNDNAHKYWRYYGGEAGLRWWFGKRHETNGKLSGHHLGVRGSVFTFDFENGGVGYMGGRPGGRLFDQACWSAGVEYGYSLPVAKRLNIDFSVTAGYTGGKIHEYDPQDGCYAVRKTSGMNMPGLTNAEISFVWILGNRKGGSR